MVEYKSWKYVFYQLITYNLEFSIKWDEEYDEEINETANFNITIDFMQNIG